LRIPQLNVIVVHAGLQSGVDIDVQDPRMLMNMRAISADGVPSARLRNGTHWFRFWKGPEHIVYGHDASAGLQLHEYTTGLDSGCCYGNKLSALVMTKPADSQGKLFAKFKSNTDSELGNLIGHVIVQVDAQKDYCPIVISPHAPE
jgi:hypothetical protein